ncbi:hypothetical protein BDV29DRAFT_153229 [Aspergillus leporis]|uniref:Carboxylesterase type B domain-containing protein n=1 Tax=Aspergillus leporis TaxID=41062 RepID=A0A5N5XAY8_9EURO|nr:hypothetical protein BDV29DRAFT_153229 [Aspergillus leporis]
MLLIYAWLWLQLSSMVAFTFAADKLINTTSGIVKGKPSPVRPGVSAYLGIRYGKAPRGDLRFAAPVPVDRSPGVFNASSFSP